MKPPRSPYIVSSLRLVRTSVGLQLTLLVSCNTPLLYTHRVIPVDPFPNLIQSSGSVYNCQDYRVLQCYYYALSNAMASQTAIIIGSSTSRSMKESGLISILASYNRACEVVREHFVDQGVERGPAS